MGSAQGRWRIGDHRVPSGVPGDRFQLLGEGARMHRHPDSYGSFLWYQNHGGTRFQVRGLTNGATYRFRIRAENAIGLGEPLDGVPVVIRYWNQELRWCQTGTNHFQRPLRRARCAFDPRSDRLRCQRGLPQVGSAKVPEFDSLVPTYGSISW